MNRAGNEKVDNKILVLPVKEGADIKEATMVALGADGYAVPASKAANLVSAGVAMRPADNRLGASGDISVVVRRGAYVFDNSATAANKVTATDILKPCYIEDSVTVSMLSTGSSVAGKILAADDDGITVEIL